MEALARGSLDVARDAWRVYTSPARLDRGRALWTAGVLAVTGVLFAFDEEIHGWFDRNEDERWYRPVRRFGDNIEDGGLVSETMPWYAGAAVLGWAFDLEWVANTSFEIIESYVVSAAGKNAALWLVGRRRPARGKGAYAFEAGEGRSFPSGHVIHAVQAATVLSGRIGSRPVSVALYGLAGTIALQRITSDHHWPSDVLLGAVYGYVTAREIMKLRDGRSALAVAPVAVDGGRGAGVAVSWRF